MRRLLLAALVAFFPAFAHATDCSNTIQVGGTAQDITTTGTLNPIGPVRGLLMMNNSTDLMCMTLNGTSPTIAGPNCGTGSFTLQPGSATAAGGSFSKPEFINIAAVKIISATTGNRYSCEFMK